jgi:putative PIN family toxin of toxin-antitoxin system
MPQPSIPNVVLDTNVIWAGLYSRRGSSFRVLSLVADGEVTITLSVPLVLEYEEVIWRDSAKLRLSDHDVNRFIDDLCAIGVRQSVWYLWPPTLQDADDDFVLEVAVAGRCDAVVTHNTKDFKRAQEFGIEALTPSQLLKRIGIDP